jgi:hypothetical protein
MFDYICRLGSATLLGSTRQLSERFRELNASVQRALERAQRSVRLLLGGEELLFDEKAGITVEVTQMFLVIFEPVVLAFFEHLDGSLGPECSRASLGHLCEGTPRPRALGRLASELKNAALQKIHAALVRLVATLELRPCARIADFVERLTVGLDRGNLTAEKRVELVDFLRHVPSFRGREISIPQSGQLGAPPDE